MGMFTDWRNKCRSGSFAEKRGQGDSDLFLIAGLGNPGAKYAHTRHNTGFDTLEILAREAGISLNGKKFQGIIGSGRIEGTKVLLLQPETFMNNSGQSIGAAVNYYRIDPARQLIVIYDDISLPVGQIRVRPKGSAGGHNGIKSIISHLGGSQEFLRVRVGVGEVPEHYDQVDWVLGHFDRNDEKIMAEAKMRAAQAAIALLTRSPEDVMSQYNVKLPGSKGTDG